MPQGAQSCTAARTNLKQQPPDALSAQHVDAQVLCSNPHNCLKQQGCPQRNALASSHHLANHILHTPTCMMRALLHTSTCMKRSLHAVIVQSAQSTAALPTPLLLPSHTTCHTKSPLLIGAHKALHAPHLPPCRNPVIPVLQAWSLQPREHPMQVVRQRPWHTCTNRTRSVRLYNGRQQAISTRYG